MHFSVRIAVGDTGKQRKVTAVHGDDIIGTEVILPCDAAGAVAVKRHAFLDKFSACRRVDSVADFLGGDGAGVNGEVLPAVCVLHQLFHYKFCHGTAADVAVADEKYFYHYISLHKPVKPCNFG